MRSPPADIFIYGVHKETTEEDIVADLKESDIIVNVRDVVKKSKPEAGLNSFKISVKAQDLQKALNPAIWPMRVKVREYIYYKRKPDSDRGSGAAGRVGGQQQHAEGRRDQHQDGAAGGGDSQGAGGSGQAVHENVPTSNRFNLLDTEMSTIQP